MSNEWKYAPLGPHDPAIVPSRCDYAVAMPRGRWRQCFDEPVTNRGEDAEALHWCEKHRKYGRVLNEVR